jgi:hypothetical protein
MPTALSRTNYKHFCYYNCCRYSLLIPANWQDVRTSHLTHYNPRTGCSWLRRKLFAIHACFWSHTAMETPPANSYVTCCYPLQ